MKGIQLVKPLFSGHTNAVAPGGTRYINSETQRLVQNVILKLEKIKMVLVKPTMVKHPLRTKLVKRCGVYARDTYVTFPL